MRGPAADPGVTSWLRALPLPRPPRSCPPLAAGRRVQALAKRPASTGLAWTRRTRPRSSSSEEDRATSMIVVYESCTSYSHRWNHLICHIGRGSASARGEDAELVALRVGQDRPRDVALAEVDVGGAESPQPGHLRLLIVTGVGPEVEMDAVLHGLR